MEQEVVLSFETLCRYLYTCVCVVFAIFESIGCPASKNFTNIFLRVACTHKLNFKINNF